jgi:hypothetical protein
VLRRTTAHNVPPLWANTATQVKLGKQKTRGLDGSQSR